MKISDLKSYSVVSSSNVKPVQAPQPKKGLGGKIMGIAKGVTDFVGAKGISEQFGADIARATVPKSQKDFVSYPKPKEVIGSAIQTGANLIPGAGKSLGILGKMAAGAGTGYAIDVGSKLQNNQESPLTPGVGTAIGTAIPVGGAAIGLGGKIVGRLLKGLGSGLSGVSTKTIESIVNNPKTAQYASERLAKNGNAKVLEENAKQIVNGISGIRQNARKSFGQGLEKLAETDIDPKTFRTSLQQTLDKFGVSGGKEGRKLGNVEFEQPKKIAKASDLINKLNTVKLDGKSLRRLSEEIEASKFKTTGNDPERLSFNAFVNELSESVKGAVTNSTDKLGDINKAFSQDMQLTEAVENIFGKVNYKNLPEVVRASQKLEGLFAQKGLAPEVVDEFLKKIGISPDDFKTTEAVRQITNKQSQANTKGLSIGEIIQQVTSSVVTPQLVRDISIKTGISDKALTPFLQSLKGLSPVLQKTLIQALVQGQ